MDPVPAGRESTPIGLRLAAVFLQLAVLATIPPLLVAAFVLVASLVVGPFESERMGLAFGFSFGSLAVFLFLLEMILGLYWLERHLNRRPFAFATQWKADAPAHPLRLLCLPALFVVAAYGLVSVCICLAAFLDDATGKWLWLLVWGTLGAAAGWLFMHLDRTLPR